MLHAVARNWWVLLIRGICAILFGLMAFAWPGITLWALIVLWGAYALADGIAAIALGVAGKAEGRPWWSVATQFELPCALPNSSAAGCR